MLFVCKYYYNIWELKESKVINFCDEYVIIYGCVILF